VVSELEFAYLQADKSGLYPVEVERNDIQCMYSPALSAELVAALDAAIVALRQQGQISQILARYR
jgi:ABC-type amino acid transport substrate-binding protein